MKIILTESQLSYIIEEEILVESLLTESVSFKNLFNKVKAALVAGISSAVILAAIARLPINDAEKKVLEDVVNQEQVDTPTEQTDTTFTQRVNAVRSYMEYAAKNQNFDPQSIQLDPEYLVRVCDEEGFDLPLLMAQAHLESCFGLTPRARRTNSVFSVGSYDNGKDACIYNTQNDSVKPYIRLMKSDYLNDKDIDQMLSPGNMVNQLNKRYASNPKYENGVKSVRNRILRMYPELK